MARSTHVGLAVVTQRGVWRARVPSQAAGNMSGVADGRGDVGVNVVHQRAVLATMAAVGRGSAPQDDARITEAVRQEQTVTGRGRVSSRYRRAWGW